MNNPHEPAPAPAQLRQAFQCVPTGIAAICATVDGRPDGMVASSFTTVSLDPPLVSVCIQDSSRTWPRLRKCLRLGVSILAEGHEKTCSDLSRHSGDRFDGVQWEAEPNGSIVIHDCTLWLECELHREVAAGDHAIVLLEIRKLRTEPSASPLVYHHRRFRRLGSAPAPR